MYKCEFLQFKGKPQPKNWHVFLVEFLKLFIKEADQRKIAHMFREESEAKVKPASK